jgi:hypothetical protein
MKPPAAEYMTHTLLRLTLILGLFGCTASTQSPPAPRAPSADKTRPLFVEPKHQRTFGAREPTPAGTVFHIQVIRKADGNAFRLHRCNDPCKTAATVTVWAPQAYRSGDQLSWRTVEDGTYYLWNQDVQTEASIPAFANEFVGKRVRITYESGAVIEAWHVLP